MADPQAFPNRNPVNLSEHSRNLSLSLDLGTTTLAGQLLQKNGAIVAAARTINPQHEIAPDILSRLQCAHDGDAQTLQGLIADGIRTITAELINQAGCGRQAIDCIVAAGNPGISCLLLGLPVDSLLFPPHKPPFKGMQQVSAEQLDLGLNSPLRLFPLVSGFVGGDLVAALYGLGLMPGKSSTSINRDGSAGISAPVLFVDIGTNAEIALWDGRRWWVTSAASGPAFEGGNISTGMLHDDGAVTNVDLTGDRLHLIVAGHGRPHGLCGSGLVALVAAARQGGLIQHDGRIVTTDEVMTNLNRYLVSRNGQPGLCYYRDAAVELTLTQDDIRNLQLAKGAVHAGIRVLLDHAGIPEEAVARVVVTGALGTALSIDALKKVALLPEAMLDKTSLEANAVLAGLRAYLMSTDQQKQLTELLQGMHPFPLSGTPAFERSFLQSLDLE